LRFHAFIFPFPAGDSKSLGQDFIVMDYGAVADGQTLCTAALQKALDTAGAAGGGTPEHSSELDRALLLEEHTAA
jgi:hypothetical protein